jgi:tetratricopeptide (TPR) repeat protein
MISKKNTAKFNKANNLFSKAIDLHNNLNFEEAKQLYLMVLQIFPNHPDTLHMLGVIDFQKSNYQSSINYIRAANILKTNDPIILFNLGNALRYSGNLKEATKAYTDSLNIDPDNLETLENLGNVYKEQNEFHEAINVYDRLLNSYPNHRQTQYNKSLTLLTMGHFGESWDLYESRFYLEFFNASLKFNLTIAPKWDGRDLNLKKPLLILQEQGLGDQIFFGSMLHDLHKLNINCIVFIDKRLFPLFKRSFPNFNLVSNPNDIFPLQKEIGFSYQIFLGSLGGILRRSEKDFFNIPSKFLHANILQSNSIRNRIKKNDTIVCGISWISRNKEFNNLKSIDLDLLLPVISIPNVQFINLQYGDVSSEINLLKNNHEINIRNFEGIDNYYDIDGLASLIESCDLIITVSNTTAHLAASLGKPTLVLLAHHTPLWYWHTDASKSPWYPSVSLLRQPNNGDWSPVIEKAANILRNLANNHL